METIFIAFLILGQQVHADHTIEAQKLHEKAKFALIKKVEGLVNIEECSKDIHSPDVPADALPRSCNKIDYFAKYFFTKSDLASINAYLTQEQTRLFSESRDLMQKYKIKTLGKVMLSQKCAINNRPVDLDQYLVKIKSNEQVLVQADSKSRQPAETAPQPTSETPEVSNHN